jgi:PAS domain S-box-containing protein
MSVTGEKRDRTMPGLVFVALGASLALFTLWQLLVSGVPGGVILLVGVVPGLLLAGLLVAVGLWLLDDGPTGARARRLLAWSLASGTFGALSASLFVLYEMNRGAVVYEAPLVVANTAAGFAVFGLVVGRYDLQARRRADELARYKELVESIPVGIFRTTPGPDGEFVQVNPAMVHLFGADDAEDLLSRPVSDIYADPADRAEFSERVMENGLVVEHELEYERFDGEQFWASITAIRFETDGRTYFDGIVEDITDRKRYEQQLERHNEQLAVLNDVLRHDVRNDMAVVRSRAEHLDAAVDGHEEDIDALLSRTDHVVELTETAGELAEVVSADRDEDCYPVALDDILHEEVTAIRQADGTVTVHVDRLPEVSVRANDMLSSVFRNLLNNAVQHNDNPEPHIDVSVDTGDDTVTVHVADNGPGIPDNQKDSIFEHGQKDDDTGGTGLGLYLVATLVDQYGGTVTVRDRDDDGTASTGEGKAGTVFAVTLQRAEKPTGGSWYD